MTDEPKTDDGLGVAGDACEKCQYPKFMCTCLPPPPKVGMMQMPAARYHSDPCETPSLSASCAHTMVSKSSAHAYLQHPRLGGKPRKPTTAMNEGTQLHASVLGRGGPTVEIVKVLDKRGLLVRDYKTKVAQTMKKEIESRGNVAMLPHQRSRTDETGIAVIAALGAKGIDFQDEGSLQEVAFFWEATASSGAKVQCRAMLDYWHQEKNLARDLKKAEDANPSELARHIVKYGTDIQVAAYTSAVGHVFPELLGRTEFELAYCEIVPPYAVTPAVLSPAFMELGKLKWQQAIDLWALYMETGEWPDYVQGKAIIDPPTWAFTDYEEAME